MNHLFKKIAFLLCLTQSVLYAQEAGTTLGEWRIHLPYNSCHYIAETPDKIYAAAAHGFFAYGKADGNIERLSSVNGFSDGEVSVMNYDPETQKLWIGYKNARIDVLTKNRITPLDDIFRSSIIGDKSINHIMFHNRRAYISTGLGIIVYDQDRMEVSENYLNLGQSVANSTIAIYGTAVSGDTLFAVAGHKILYGLIRPNINLADFNNWTIMDSSLRSRHIASFRGAVYAELDSMLQVWDGNTWTVLYDSSYSKVNSLKVHNGHLIICLDNLIEVIKPGGSTHKMQKNATVQGLVSTDNHFWYVTKNYGLIKLNSDSSEFFFQPNGPNTESSFRMANHNHGFWVTAGSYSLEYTHTYNHNGYNIFRDNRWTHNPYRETSLRPVHDFTAIAKHPSENRIFIGTQGKGVIEFEGDIPVNWFTFRNSSIKYFDNRAGDSLMYCSGVAFDKKGNLWVTNYESDSSLHVFTADRIWKAFRLPTRYTGEMLIDGNDYKWIITPRPNLSGSGICVYDDNQTPLHAEDDRIAVLTTQNADLPTNLVRCMALMPNNEIWVGTDAGLVVFRNPRNIFSGTPIKADRIIIEQGGVGGYLLGSEVIYSIAVDGAGRRWVGTNKGAWLIARNGMDILRHYHKDNSPLTSDNVFTVGVDEITGEVFFGTDKGLFSVKGDATKPEEQMGKLKIFPNPVRETFHGEVAIEGLALESRVKITDINGNLIYETLSNGGRATWNCRTFAGQRPATGVYLVFAIDGSGEQTAMGKILFVK